MYRCMLNKAKERPRAILVPLEEYKGAMSKYARKARRQSEPGDSDPGASFVLFHADLVDACTGRGILADSDPSEMWAVISRWSETWHADDDDY